MITKEILKEKLKNSTAVIEFRKVDQSIRKMNCTLSAQFLPKSEVTDKEENKTIKDNPNNMRVWDLDKEAWRSFRIDSILDYSFNQI